MNKYKLPQFVKVLTVSILIAHSSPLYTYSALEIEQSVSQTQIETDTNQKTVTYSAIIKNTDSCKTPLDVAFALDVSQSMVNSPNTNETLELAKKQSHSILDRLVTREDYLSLVTFSNTAVRDLPLPSDPQSAKTRISNINIDTKSANSTNIGEGIRLAAEELNSVRHHEGSERVLVLITQGQSTSPSDTGESYAVSQANLAKQSGIKVFPIGMGNNVNSALLNQIGTSSSSQVLNSESQIEAITNSILNRSRGSARTNITVWDDVSDIIDIASFNGASHGGVLTNNKVVWTIPELECGQTITLSYSFTFRSNNASRSVNNTIYLTDSTGTTSQSNAIQMVSTSPNLVISKTDNRTRASNNDIIDYQIKIRNIGDGYAYDASVYDTLPEYMHFLNSDILNLKRNGQELSWNISSLAPGTELNFTITAKLIFPESNILTRIINSSRIENNEFKAQNEDMTEVTQEETPNFNLFVNCIETNTNNKTFTAHFGYINRNDKTEMLSESKVIPETLEAEPIKSLQPGRHDKIFTVVSDLENDITWMASSQGYQTSATANKGYLDCTPSDQGETDGQDGTIENESSQVVTTPENLPLYNPNTISGFEPLPSDTKESVDFSINEGMILSSCENKEINMSGVQVDTTYPVATIEYSLDDGLNWYPVETFSANGDITTFSDKTRSLQDKNYIIKFKVQTLTGNIFISHPYPHLHSCDGNGNILGSYYKNGFGHGVITDKSSLIFNEDLPLEVYTETIGGITDLKLHITDIANKGAAIPISMKYQAETDLWYAQIPASALKGYQHNVNITGEAKDENITKELPSIINPSKHLNRSNATGYKYELFVKTDRGWQPYDYNNKDNDISPQSSHKVFTLQPGEYFAKVRYPNQDNYFTKSIKLNNQGVIQIITPEEKEIKGIAGLRNFVNTLDIKTFEENISDDKHDTNTGTLSTNAPLSTIANTQTDSKMALVYWNKWNPYFDEQMSVLEELNKRANSNGKTLQLMVVSDWKNHHELVRTLKVRESSLESSTITDAQLLLNEFVHTPEIILLDKQNNHIERIRGNIPIEELYQELVNIKFIQ